MLVTIAEAMLQKHRKYFPSQIEDGSLSIPAEITQYSHGRAMAEFAGSQAKFKRAKTATSLHQARQDQLDAKMAKLEDRNRQCNRHIVTVGYLSPCLWCLMNYLRGWKFFYMEASGTRIHEACRKRLDTWHSAAAAAVEFCYDFGTHLLNVFHGSEGVWCCHWGGG